MSFVIAASGYHLTTFASLTSFPTTLGERPVKAFVVLTQPWVRLMQHINPEFFIELGRKIQTARTNWGIIAVGDEQREDWIRTVSQWQNDCQFLGLPAASASAARVAAVLGEAEVYQLPSNIAGDIRAKFPGGQYSKYKPVDKGQLQRQVEEFERVFLDELKSKKFVQLDLDKQGYIDQAELFGNIVAARFPDAQSDIREVGNCLALNRPTAAVFHAMRVLEIGLGRLAAPFNVPSANTNWQNIIDQIESAIQRMNATSHGPDWRQDQQFYSDAASHFYFLKNAWRNQVAHVHQTYDDSQALQICSHVKQFMEQLAKKL